MSDDRPAAPPDAAAATAPTRPPRPAWIGRALFEAALIGLSVALGFAVTEWRDRQAARQRARQALDAIVLELERNRDLAHAARLRQRAKADTLDRYVKSEAPMPPAFYMYGMWDPARVTSTAWEAARGGDALRELPYPLVMALGDLYERQRQYRELSDDLTHDMYTDFRRDGAAAHLGRNPEAWWILNRDFADRAGRLEEAYARTLVAVRDTRRRLDR